MNSSGISISAGAKIKMDAAQIEASAGMVTVNAPMSKFSGVVQCDVLIANTVVGTSYTPGVGNLW
jgi:hypothetical protein